MTLRTVLRMTNAPLYPPTPPHQSCLHSLHAFPYTTHYSVQLRSLKQSDITGLLLGCLKNSQKMAKGLRASEFYVSSPLCLVLLNIHTVLYVQDALSLCLSSHTLKLAAWLSLSSCLSTPPWSLYPLLHCFPLPLCSNPPTVGFESKRLEQPSPPKTTKNPLSDSRFLKPGFLGSGESLNMAIACISLAVSPKWAFFSCCPGPLPKHKSKWSLKKWLF